MKETKESGTVSAYQLEGHVKDQLPVSLRDAPEKLTQPLKKLGGFAGLAPFITLAGARQLFERLDARDGVAVLDSGDVATLQASAPLDVPLRYVLLLADGTNAIGDYHRILLISHNSWVANKIGILT